MHHSETHHHHTSSDSSEANCSYELDHATTYIKSVKESLYSISDEESIFFYLTQWCPSVLPTDPHRARVARVGNR